jgi:hypothetical protein
MVVLQTRPPATTPLQSLFAYATHRYPADTGDPPASTIAVAAAGMAITHSATAATNVRDVRMPRPLPVRSPRLADHIVTSGRWGQQISPHRHWMGRAAKPTRSARRCALPAGHRQRLSDSDAGNADITTAWKISPTVAEE